MRQGQTVLLISSSPFISGAEKSLIEFLNSQRVWNCILIVSKRADFSDKVGEDNVNEIIESDLIWFRYTVNPIKILVYIINIFIQSIRISHHLKRKQISLILCNSFKAYPYGMLTSFLLKKRVACRIRDNPDKLQECIIRLLRTEVIPISQWVNVFNREVVYPGINLAYWSPRNINKPKDPALPKVVAHVGQLVPWKKHECFIYAAEEILKDYGNVEFIICGSDHLNNNSEYVLYLKNLVSNRGLDKSVKFLGHKSRILEWFQEIDILVHTAQDEPFGRVIIEAMSLEKPVIAVNNGGPSEIIIHKKNGYLVKPTNIVSSIVEVATNLLNDEELCQAIGKEARMHVQRNFGIKEQAEKMSKKMYELSRT